MTTSIPPPPPPLITRQRPANHRQNPKQRVPYNPSVNHATILPTTIIEPTSFTVVNNSSEWRQAMKEEYDALMKNGTWSLVLHASNTNVVDGKWVYMLKRDKNDVITCYKARFITKGFWQQLDVHNAFLHGNLKEQAPHAWFECLSKALFDLGFKGSKTDPSLFIYSRGHTLLYILVYVDDIIVTELLQSDGLSNCNLVSSPMVTSSSLSLDDSSAFSNPMKYQQVVGSLQYVTLSQPDIAFAVNKVCQYMHAPIENHWFAVKWILRYLRGRVEHGNPDTSLEAFSDADWQGIQTIDGPWGDLLYLALLYELGIRSSSTPILWCDNLGATYLSANPIFRARTKHIEIDYHFVWEKVAQGDLRV
ncbi:putative RNA-directed DNA polymerase [Tanacetum coccineum]